MKRFMHDPHSSSEPFIGIQMAAESVLLEAARPRGMQVYARHLEGFHPSKAMQMRNFAKVA